MSNLSLRWTISIARSSSVTRQRTYWVTAAAAVVVTVAVAAVVEVITLSRCPWIFNPSDWIPAQSSTVNQSIMKQVPSRWQPMYSMAVSTCSFVLDFFSTVHSLMNYRNLIDSCQAHLPAQCASNTELIRQKCHWCWDWQRATQESHVQNKFLVGSIGCPCSSWLVRFFRFNTPKKPLKRIYFKYKTVLIPKLKII